MLYGGLIVAIFAAVLNGVETYVLIKYSFAEGLAPWSRRVARLNAHITALVAREKLSEELGQERKKKGSSGVVALCALHDVCDSATLRRDWSRAARRRESAHPHPHRDPGCMVV